MKTSVFLIGVIVFVLGFAAFFLSGSTSGPTPETSAPTVPFLYGTNQTIWMLIGAFGFVLTVIGAVLKGKKK